MSTATGLTTKRLRGPIAQLKFSSKACLLQIIHVPSWPETPPPRRLRPGKLRGPLAKGFGLLRGPTLWNRKTSEMRRGAVRSTATCHRHASSAAASSTYLQRPQKYLRCSPEEFADARRLPQRLPIRRRPFQGLGAVDCLHHTPNQATCTLQNRSIIKPLSAQGNSVAFPSPSPLHHWGQARNAPCNTSLSLRPCRRLLRLLLRLPPQMLQTEGFRSALIAPDPA